MSLDPNKTVFYHATQRLEMTQKEHPTDASSTHAMYHINCEMNQVEYPRGGIFAPNRNCSKICSRIIKTLANLMCSQKHDPMK